MSCIALLSGTVDAVKKTEQKLNRKGLSANLGVYDALNLPYEDNFFDAVIDVGCICCNKYEDCVKMYKKIHQILKGRGDYCLVDLAMQQLAMD